MIKTASVLFFYGIGILGYSQQQVLNRGYYALNNTKGAVVINTIVISVNILLSYLLVRHMGAEGLAFAYSIAGTLSMFLLFYGLKLQVPSLKSGRIMLSLMKTYIASLVMAGAVHYAIKFGEPYLILERKSAQLLELYLLIMLGAAVYIVMAKLMHIEELDSMLEKLQAKFSKN